MFDLRVNSFPPNHPVKPIALIVTTTNWVPTARLAVAFAATGFKVEILCPIGHPVTKTRAVSRIHRYQGLTPLRSLLRAIRVAKPDLLVSGDDLAASHLREVYRSRATQAGKADELCNLIERSLGSPSSFEAANDRAAFIKLAREQGIRVPQSRIVGTVEEVTKVVQELGLPVVLKADGSSGGEGVRVVRNTSEAIQAFQALRKAPRLSRAFKRALVNQDQTLIWPSLSRRRPHLSAQAFVEGREATSTVACWEGTVVAALHFEVLRKSHAAGHATVVRLVENAEMSASVEKIVRAMDLSGLCGFDFMLEAATGNACMIEFNPRATQVGHIALGAGRDLPVALYEMISDTLTRLAPAVTENDTIALFPHEWARDPQSEFLRTGYHDVPWGESELVHFCMDRSRKQSKWYLRSERQHQELPAKSSIVKTHPENSAAARIPVR